MFPTNYFLMPSGEAINLSAERKDLILKSVKITHIPFKTGFV
jgi:hypothetical protein